MNSQIKILTSIGVAIIVIGGFTSIAFAANPPLEVTFSSDPLFEVQSFLPGSSEEAEITIKNNGAGLRSAYIEAVSVSDADNLAAKMKLEIFEGGNETAFRTYNFADFLKTGPVLLSNIGEDTSKIYRLKVTFLENANDGYQGKSLGFDICVGFSGGSELCTKEAVVGPEGDTGGGGSGGGGSGSRHLVILSEEDPITSLDESQVSGTALLVWETNLPSTSQVIYRLASDDFYTLDLNVLPGLGYPLFSNENMSKTLSHSVLLTGLTPGTTYVYRVVSRASPPTISYEHEFTVPTFYQNGNVITAGSLGLSEEGEILGASVGDDGKATDATSTRDENNLAAVFASGWQGLLSWWWLLVLLLLVAYFVWRATSRKKNE